MNDQIVAAVCSGAVVVAVIETLRALGGFILKRWAKKKDRQEEREDKKIDEQFDEIKKNQDELKQNQKEQDDRMQRIEDTLAVQKETYMFILYDRLRYLAKCYIAEGEVSFEDLETWNQMHIFYHQNGGNGKLKPMEDAVNSLLIKRG